MPPILALIFCLGFVIVLLYFERRQNPTASFALWIPTVWMLICGSRPLGHWFELNLSDTSPEAGSPIDRYVLSTLILLSILVVYMRRVDWSSTLKNNRSLIFLYLFLGISILWSDIPDVSARRWIRLLGAIPIAMVVLSERSPLAALESIFRRVAYVLLPFSVLFIKYYPHWGVTYGRWSGLPSWKGVTLGKNALGQLCAISIIFIIWAYLRERRGKGFLKTGFIKVTDGLILVIANFLLIGIGGAYSATSVSVLLVGTLFLLILYQMERTAKSISFLIIFVIFLVWILLTFYEPLVSVVTEILGRDETFTGRTDMWRMTLEAAARNPILGTGFGSYWGTTGNKIAEAFGGTVTGHNGLLDVYVETGIIGIILLLGFHLGFYGRFRKEINRNFDWAVFGICFLVIGLLCNYTESLFLRSSSYYWNITIFLSIIFSGKYLNKDRNDLLPAESIKSSS